MNTHASNDNSHFGTMTVILDSLNAHICTIWKASRLKLKTPITNIDCYFGSKAVILNLRFTIYLLFEDFRMQKYCCHVFTVSHFGVMAVILDFQNLHLSIS